MSTNEELAERMRNGDRDAAAELWQNNQGLIRSLVQCYRGFVEDDDLMQQAYLGLHNAALNYNPDREALFSTYLPFWVRQSVNRYISNNRSAIRLPEYLQRRIYSRSRQIGELGQMLGREPTKAEIIQYIGPVTDAEERAEALSIDSLDREIADSDGRTRTLADTIADPDDCFDDVIEHIENEELAGKLWPIVDELPEPQADVIRKHYREGMSFKAIGEEAGISEKGARQREKAAIDALRRKRKIKELWDNSKAYSMGLKGNGVGTFMRTWESSTERAALKLIEDELKEMGLNVSDIFENL